MDACVGGNGTWESIKSRNRGRQAAGGRYATGISQLDRFDSLRYAKTKGNPKGCVSGGWIRESSCILPGRAKLWSGSVKPSPAALIRAAFRWVRLLGSFQKIKDRPTGGLLCWSRIRESSCILPGRAKLWSGSVKPSPAALIRAAFRWVRLLGPFQKIKDRPTGGLLCWSRIRESNPPSRLGKPLYYRYTNPASDKYYSRRK